MFLVAYLPNQKAYLTWDQAANAWGATQDKTLALALTRRLWDSTDKPTCKIELVPCEHVTTPAPKPSKKPSIYCIRQVNEAMNDCLTFVQSIRDYKEDYSHEYKAALVQLERAIRAVKKFH